jgi:NADH-quinone oxidoreductase subunit N
MNFLGEFEPILPELVLLVVACALFLLGVSSTATARRMAAQLALVAMVVVIGIQGFVVGGQGNFPHFGAFGAVETGPFANYVKLMAAAVGALLVLLAWPMNAQATGSKSLDFGRDAGEFYALMLLSLAGLMLVAGANDLMLLFLGIELASIPTYIMVSMSRPIPAAQEAGVKYFFLGAMAAAIMLFGFSYLYGTTGVTKLSEIREVIAAQTAGGKSITQWQVLAVCMLMAGFAFKIAAVPLHTYVGDVYQGAATPVTAFLAFVPKTSGFVAIVKVLLAVGGTSFTVPVEIVNLMWALAALTMTVGNVLGLLQHNVKRVLAYSSIAHSGYMLVGITALVAAGDPALGLAADDRVTIQRLALSSVLFYMFTYGIMNTGAFGVLMILPSHEQRYDLGDGHLHHAPPATTAETYEDLAGSARRHMSLALAMAVCCFSLIGLPLTVGFFGKLYLVQPALDVGTSQMNWLAVIMVANAAIGAAYYLRIVATMFLRAEPHGPGTHAPIADLAHAHGAHRGEDIATERGRPWWASPVGVAIVMSMLLTLIFGVVFPATSRLSDRTYEAATIRPSAVPAGVPAAAPGGVERPVVALPPPAPPEVSSVTP